MAGFSTIYIIGSFPDRLNTNTVIREYAAEGFAEAAPEVTVYNVDQTRFLGEVEPRAGDLCLFMGSVLLPEFLVEAMFSRARRGGAKVCVWLQDDPYEFDASSRLAGTVDAIFTNDRSASYHYPEDTPVFHVPLAASRRHVRRVESRTGPDYFFAGYPYPNRMDFFLNLHGELSEKTECIRGLLVGPGWELSELREAVPLRVDTDTLNKMYRNALSTIYLGRTYDLANRRFGIRASTPGPRLFEAAAAGACQIVLTPGLEVVDYLTPGREMIFIDTVAEAAQAIRGLRLDRDRSLAIGRDAQKRVVAEHLYVHRARTIIDTMLQL